MIRRRWKERQRERRRERKIRLGKAIAFGGDRLLKRVFGAHGERATRSKVHGAKSNGISEPRRLFAPPLFATGSYEINFAPGVVSVRARDQVFLL